MSPALVLSTISKNPEDIKFQLTMWLSKLVVDTDISVKKLNLLIISPHMKAENIFMPSFNNKILVYLEIYDNYPL